MKKRLLSIALLASAWGAYAQVGIGTLTPNNSAQLDVVATDKGILIPRVALTSSEDTQTIKNGNVNSLLVFNTNTENDITPGYYYWFDNKWMRIVNEDEVIALDKNTTNISFTSDDGVLILTDSDDNIVSIPISDLNIPTDIANNNDGTYTYTNEEGTLYIIDVPASVVNQFENIYNQIVNDSITIDNVFYNSFEEYLTTIVNNNTNFEDNDFITITGTGTDTDPFKIEIKEGANNTMLITNDTGQLEWATIEDIVKANETLTVLGYNPTTNQLTYKDEDLITTTLDLNVGSVAYNPVTNAITYTDAA